MIEIEQIDDLVEPIVISSDDGLAPYTDALVANLTKLGDTQVKSIHIPTDHSYSDHRIALQQTVLEGLDYLQSHR